MKRIAVVEDNPDNRVLVRAILEDLYEVDEYDDAAAALAGLRRSPPDALLLDISLPEMDGVELLGALRADPVLRAIPVAALTAHAMAGDRERYLSAGFDAYLSKPIIDSATLVSTIAALINPPVR